MCRIFDPAVGDAQRCTYAWTLRCPRVQIPRVVGLSFFCSHRSRPCPLCARWYTRTKCRNGHHQWRHPTCSALFHNAYDVLLQTSHTRMHISVVTGFLVVFCIGWPPRRGIVPSPEERCRERPSARCVATRIIRMENLSLALPQRFLTAVPCARW